MSDFFLSYAHEDLEQAATLASLLEANGLSVWWDRRMVAGDRFHTLIDQELEKARAVIVLWSPASIESDWVLGEAQTARDANKLVPVKIADCKLPIPYRSFHTPEIYKSAGELGRLAQLLSEKHGRVQSSSAPVQLSQITFSAASTSMLLDRFKRIVADYREAELKVRNGTSKDVQEFDRKYGWLSIVVMVVFILLFTVLLGISPNFVVPGTAGELLYPLAAFAIALGCMVAFSRLFSKRH